MTLFGLFAELRAVERLSEEWRKNAEVENSGGGDNCADHNQNDQISGDAPHDKCDTGDSAGPATRGGRKKFNQSHGDFRLYLLAGAAVRGGNPGECLLDVLTATGPSRLAAVFTVDFLTHGVSFLYCRFDTEEDVRSRAAVPALQVKHPPSRFTALKPCARSNCVAVWPR